MSQANRIKTVEWFESNRIFVVMGAVLVAVQVILVVSLVA